MAIYFESDGKRKDAISHFENIILSELNAKKIEFSSKLDELVEYDIKPNLMLVGKKYGPMIPAIKKALLKVSQAQIALKVKNEKTIKLDIDGSTIKLEPDEILVQIKNRDDNLNYQICIYRDAENGTCEICLLQEETWKDRV